MMNRKHFFIVVFVAFTATQAMAETLLNNVEQEQVIALSSADSDGTKDAGTTANTPTNTPQAGKDKEIVGTSAGGDKQTTVIDNNGNLKIVEPKDKSQQERSSAGSPSHHTDNATNTPPTQGSPSIAPEIKQFTPNNPPTVPNGDHTPSVPMSGVPSPADSNAPLKPDSTSPSTQK
jgi:hypothetical protein